MFKRSYINGHEGHPHHIDDKKVLLLKNAFKDANKHQDIILVLKNLSDPTKLSIYILLQKVDEIPVTDICHILDLNPSAASHALSDLKKLDLVQCSRCGQLMCYSLKKQPKRRMSILSIFKQVFA